MFLKSTNGFFWRYSWRFIPTWFYQLRRGFFSSGLLLILCTCFILNFIENLRSLHCFFWIILYQHHVLEHVTQSLIWSVAFAQPIPCFILLRSKWRDCLCSAAWLQPQRCHPTFGFPSHTCFIFTGRLRRLQWCPGTCMWNWCPHIPERLPGGMPNPWFGFLCCTPTYSLRNLSDLGHSPRKS